MGSNHSNKVVHPRSRPAGGSTGPWGHEGENCPRAAYFRGGPARTRGRKGDYVVHFTFLHDGAAQRTAECPTLEEAIRSIEVGQVDRTLWSIQYMDREGGTRATDSPRTSETVTKDERAEPNTTTPDRGVTRICAWRPFRRCGSRLVSSGNGSSSTVGRPSREGESRRVGLCQVTTL
ncbi:MAG: hypothetical protein K0Q46_2738 [Rhodococcus erythropolis]|jgi:hypothetical protein|nr:hypothetical protein [Rhodococcus erythropolis]